MFRFIGNLIKGTFGIVGLILIFFLACFFGYGIYWFLEYFFVNAVELEWITNQYITPVIMWLFEGEYSDIIELIMVIGFGVLYTLGKSSED
jgi:hypothetical protein|tara:strand:- start:285 stop:557 length:273 start_codon:yes stop_codon:yes gene_type:complete